MAVVFIVTFMAKMGANLCPLEELTQINIKFIIFILCSNVMYSTADVYAGLPSSYHLQA